MNGAKIKYHAEQIIKLADYNQGLVKEYPAYKVPDLSRLHQNISRDWIYQLWRNFFNPRSQWTTWDAIYNHGRIVMGFSHEQMIEIGEALGFLKEEEGEEDPPMLIVKGKRLYFKDGGTKPIILMGCSPRQLLSAELGYVPAIPFTLIQEIARWEEHGTNYCRIDAVEDYAFTYGFCKQMEEKNIIVQLTLVGCVSDRTGDYKEHVRRTKGLNNMIYELENEFGNDLSRVQAAVDKANWLLGQGVIISGGAWGNSKYGEKHAETFRNYDINHINDLHRPYPPLSVLVSYISGLENEGKPILWNEVLAGLENYPSVPADEVEHYMRGAIQAGVNGINVYQNEFIDIAGKLCKEFNP